MSYEPIISGRAARRQRQFSARRKGAGWTRPFRKGREQRHSIQEMRARAEEAARLALEEAEAAEAAEKESE